MKHKRKSANKKSSLDSLEQLGRALGRDTPPAKSESQRGSRDTDQRANSGGRPGRPSRDAGRGGGGERGRGAGGRGGQRRDGHGSGNGNRSARLPQRQPVADAWLAQRTPGTCSAHLGLAYARYWDSWEQRGWRLDSKTILPFLTRITQVAAEHPCTTNGFYPAVLQRRQALLDGLAAAGYQLIRFTAATTWRLVTGLGMPNPGEAGFAWHHTYGVPYLPGPTLKGVARAWCREAEWPADEIAVLFGPESDDDNPTRGLAVFFDALPASWPALQPDVLTPHQKPYYEGDTPQEPPADWHDPSPSYFLTVAPGERFDFAVAVPGTATNGQRERIAAALQNAIMDLGVGAKTAAGYGYFDPPASGAA